MTANGDSMVNYSLQQLKMWTAFQVQVYGRRNVKNNRKYLHFVEAKYNF